MRFATGLLLLSTLVIASAFLPSPPSLVVPSSLRNPTHLHDAEDDEFATLIAQKDTATKPTQVYTPKEGENDYGGGSKFKRLMELAAQKKQALSSGTNGAAVASATPSAVQAAATPAALPPGWASSIDPSSGRTYYYSSSGETSWDPPAAVEQPAVQKQVSPEEVDQLKKKVDLFTMQIKDLNVQLDKARNDIATLEEDIKAKEVIISKLESAAADAKAAAAPAPPSEPAASAVVSEPPKQEEEKEKYVPTEADNLALYNAVLDVDATKVTSLLQKGLTMNEETTDAAFWSVVKAVDTAEKEDKPLSADVPQMLHHIFDADLAHLLTREQIRTNLTCMQPTESGLTTHGMNYIFDDSSHKDLPLEEGRRCEDGSCCDACSRNIFPTFATDAESDLNTFPEISSFTFNDLETVSSATILHFTRLVERVRRTMAHEYGLPLKSLLPLQAYSRKYVAGTTQQGGGGGEGDFVTLHTDEATHTGYHYSCVLYLSTAGVDFEGGDFVFNDPADKTEEDKNKSEDEEEEELELMGISLAEQIRRAGRKFTPYSPQRGAAVIFSSGWENMHEVEKITSGVRYAVPCFFTTCPVPDIAYDQMVAGKPKTNEDIADDWLHLLLAHREELPQESVGRVKELLMKWHYMCAPLDQH
mmetsp:Transcript_26376/g.38593  ORF Transcript_26376/g.38593 Transcript_26376/m.38593 type:complete len:645 (+) Transcript_26376:241-2175(+)